MGELRAHRWTLVACARRRPPRRRPRTLAARAGDGPHRAPLTIAAPAVVAQQLAEEAAAMPGQPFEADWTDDAAAAREAVRSGRSVAAVPVDLRETHDVVP